jgi:hypothetical protein
MAIEETESDVPLYRVAEHIVGDLHHLLTAEWDRALKELIAAARAGKLRVSGRRDGNARSEAVRPNDFAEVGDNPVADFDFAIEYSGNRVLEFHEEYEARILESQSTGKPAVLWTDVCADSGAEVLRLWPPTPPPIEDPVLLRVQEALRDAIEKKGKPLTTREAEDIASDIVGQKKSREMLLTVQLPQKQGRRRKEPKRA